jgi:hypothetical protein
MKNVEMTNEQYRQWSGAQQQRGSRLWALWWGLLTILVVAAMLMLAVDHFAPGIFSGLFRRAGFVVEQLPATAAPVPTMAPPPAPYIPAPVAAPAVVITVVVPPPPTTTPCTDTFYNAQSGRNECAGLGGGGGGPYGTPEPEPPAPGQPSFAESFQAAPDNGAFIGCLAISCNPGAAPTPWPTSSGPRPGQPGFADSFR